jgi:hypothetical protein
MNKLLFLLATHMSLSSDGIPIAFTHLITFTSIHTLFLSAKHFHCFKIRSKLCKNVWLGQVYIRYIFRIDFCIIACLSLYKILLFICIILLNLYY